MHGMKRRQKAGAQSWCATARMADLRCVAREAAHGRSPHLRIRFADSGWKPELRGRGGARHGRCVTTRPRRTALSPWPAQTATAAHAAKRRWPHARHLSSWPAQTATVAHAAKRRWPHGRPLPSWPAQTATVAHAAKRRWPHGRHLSSWFGVARRGRLGLLCTSRTAVALQVSHDRSAWPQRRTPSACDLTASLASHSLSPQAAGRCCMPCAAEGAGAGIRAVERRRERG